MPTSRVQLALDLSDLEAATHLPTVLADDATRDTGDGEGMCCAGGAGAAGGCCGGPDAT